MAAEMAALRIYLMIDYYLGPVAGTERQLHLLAEGLVERGHDVRLFVLRHTPYTRQGTGLPCPVECLDVGSILSLSTLRKMRAFRRRVRSERPDVVHAFFNDSAILAPLACRTPTTRVFTSRRDMGYWYTPKYLLALALANRWASGIICNSHAVAAEVRRREWVRRDQLTVIHNARPPGDAPPAAAGDQPAGSPHRPPGEIRACLVANLRPVKRIEDLIRATAKARDAVPQLVLRIVGGRGDERYAGSLEDLARQLGLADAVQFLPATDRPLEFMQQCDIGVLSSASEGLSNTLMEYMSCGLPVVCSDVGGNPELVSHGEQGFLYPVGDINALAECLVMLARDPALRKDMGREGRLKLSRLSPSRILDEQLQIYIGREPTKVTGGTLSDRAP